MNKEIKSQWHLTRDEIAKVIEEVRAENPSANPHTIYLAILKAQKRKEALTETLFARNLLTGDLLSVSYFEGRIISVDRVNEIPVAFLEAFKEG